MRWIIFLLCFISQAWAAEVRLSWNANTEPDLAGYRIHYGTASGNYTSHVDVGNVTTCLVPGLADGVRYYFAATAYDNETPSLESGYSNEVNWQSGEPPVFIGATNIRASKLQIGAPPMAVEKILGYNTASDADYITVSGSSNYAYGKVYTASWSGAASSVTCTTGKIRVTEWDSGTYNFKIVVWNASTGAVIGSTGAISAASPEWGTWAWWTGTFSPGITINKSTDYRIGFVFNSSVYGAVLTAGTGTTVLYDTTNSYSTPATFGNDGNTGDADLGVYLEADTAGGGASAVPANRGNVGMMLGMSNAMWFDNDFLKPTGGN